jgi:hypothetical protein
MLMMNLPINWLYFYNIPNTYKIELLSFNAFDTNQRIVKNTSGYTKLSNLFSWFATLITSPWSTDLIGNFWYFVLTCHAVVRAVNSTWDSLDLISRALSANIELQEYNVACWLYLNRQPQIILQYYRMLMTIIDQIDLHDS